MTNENKKKIPTNLPTDIPLRDTDRQWRRIFIVDQIWDHMKLEIDQLGYNKSDIVNAALVHFYSSLDPHQRYELMYSTFRQGGFRAYGLEPPEPIKNEEDP